MRKFFPVFRIKRAGFLTWEGKNGLKIVKICKNLHFLAKMFKNVRFLR
jgi:hypothetical protein